MQKARHQTADRTAWSRGQQRPDFCVIIDTVPFSVGGAQSPQKGAQRHQFLFRVGFPHERPLSVQDPTTLRSEG